VSPIFAFYVIVMAKFFKLFHLYPQPGPVCINVEKQKEIIC
jgi:hypothetical protein